MILVVSKKAKQKTEPQADREMAIEAAYFARKFGLTKRGSAQNPPRGQRRETVA
ncbi:hypothetical protein [Mesorhizobium caraganae]|uniref:hypothetical protein n=1 Tax=Mesorhizobium caraganae TaxID=483206 RepID=UPI00177D0F78|nr:hypothetical protein [Mesorhizobium caraganae]